jgi:alpha-L-fucosidase 2
MDDGTSLELAEGLNVNPFFETAQVKDPLISRSARLNDVVLERTFLFDFPTEAGRTYTLHAIE